MMEQMVGFVLDFELVLLELERSSEVEQELKDHHLEQLEQMVH